MVLLLSCLGFPVQAGERTSKTSTSAHPKKSTAKAEVNLAPAERTYEDWQLPSFVANAHTPASQAPVLPPTEEKKAIASKTKSSPVGKKDEKIASLSHSVTPKETPAPAKTLATFSTSKHSLSVAASPTFSTASSTPAPTAPPAKKSSLSGSLARAAMSTASAAGQEIGSLKKGITGRLARLTAYWAGEGDYYTGRCLSSTGIHLHGGHCAVDPSIIPYGSVVEIPGVGQFLAVDTGSAVISREAAREAGHNRAERGALVIDLFFEHRSEGERFAADGAKFVPISWWTPSSTENEAKQARIGFADEDWNKIYSKQL